MGAEPDIESLASSSEGGAQNFDERKTTKQSRDVHEKEHGKSKVGEKIDGILAKLSQRGGVEIRGCVPVPYEERDVTSYWNIFSLWFCLSCNLLP